MTGLSTALLRGKKSNGLLGRSLASYPCPFIQSFKCLRSGFVTENTIPKRTFSVNRHAPGCRKGQ